MARTSFLAREVYHHRASRVRNTSDGGARFFLPNQIWRRAAFFAQGHFVLLETKFAYKGGFTCWNSLRQLLVFSVTPFKRDQNKKSKPFNRLTPESGNRKKVDIQRLSPRFRSQQFFLWKICEETFSPNL